MSGPRIPVTVVTGLLGAGKTTLLSHLIAESGRRRLAVVVNELGEASIEGVHAQDEDVEIHGVPSAVVVYGTGEDLAPTLREILARDEIIDHVLVETAGRALPTTVMAQLEEPEFKDDFVLDVVVTVVDTPQLLAMDAQAARATLDPWFVPQLETSDLAVLNKIDALTDDALSAAETRLRTLAPGVRFIELAYDARIMPRLLLGLRLHQEAFARTAPRHAGATPQTADAVPTPQGSPSARGEEPTSHGHFQVKDPGWQSFSVRTDTCQNLEALLGALQLIAQDEPVLRAKGLVNVGEGGRRVLIQGVRTRIDVDEQARKAASSSQMMFIGYYPSRERTLERLNSLTSGDWR
ncbi:MAG: GTP-binding protein [Betaproteobacteria bacterium]|nr:GTP-binding protein [Betaproteobacteria bacterium]